MEAIIVIEKPQLLLPFVERDYIDMRHACRILGAPWTMVYRLHQKGEIHVIDYRHRAWKRVHYRSIVDYCDRLRKAFCIPDRKPALSAEFLRYRDEDILPFPIADTISMMDALTALGLTRHSSVEALIDEGQIEGYTLMEGAKWRISRKSLLFYLERICTPALRMAR